MYKALFLALLVGCAGDTTLDITGSYTDEWGSTHQITDDMWVIDGQGKFHVLDYDNADGFLVAHNDADNEYSPDLYSRFDWQQTDDGLFYCQSAFDAASEDAAASVSAGASLTDGCGGFSWTNLTPPSE